MWHSIEQAISIETGKPFYVSTTQEISLGGTKASAFTSLLDNKAPPLNLTFKVSDGQRSYFIKINNKDYLENFQAEAYSLKQLNTLANIA
ncbi:MAG: fructosamine kinase family protein, partial [Colwellia sp.]|nr:fructosamine kinase family protein [Colwellia sp.]